MNYRFITTLLLIFWTLGLPQLSRAAATKGPYVGGQLGWSDVHQGEYIGNHLNDLVQKVIPDLSTKSLNVLFNDTGCAGRVFLGYQFNRYFAVELGYYRFPRLDVKTDVNMEMLIFNRFKLPLEVTTHSTVNTYAVDLVGKGILPIADKLNVYAKLGLAYLNADGSVNVAAKTTIVNNIQLGVSVDANPSINLVYPTFGLGMSYDVTDHFSADIFYNRIQQISNKSFPSVDFAGVGLTYRFD